MITKKYYKLIRVSYADSDYFRVTNISDQIGTLTINGSNNLGCNIEYSTDGVNWTTADPNAPFSLAVPSNANVYMRGTNNSLSNKTINMDVNHTVGGNVYSLLDKATYASRTTSVQYREFRALFQGNTHLVSAGNMNFGNVTTLAHQECYRAMFQGCTSLIVVPELPATTLSTGCYTEMFYGCSNITAAPELLATTLKDYCYEKMFYDCTSLTTAPELLATTLKDFCYVNMFQGCTSLNNIKCLATDISANGCTLFWLGNVSANGTFTKSANMSSWTIGGDSGIPSGWTVVDA